MSYDVIMMIIFGVVILIGGIAYLVMKSSSNKPKQTNKPQVSVQKAATTKEENPYKHSNAAGINKEDIFKFMEFDRILDDMIIQQNGEKYTAVIKCKGINYNLMSEVEQLAVEEGFMNFLNTLKFPIQLYVQAQSINLKNNISEYKSNMKGLMEEYDDVSLRYNSLINSLESTDEEIENVEDERNSLLNVLEYGQDIVRYVEKLALNKSMLQRSFYILVSYYKSELSNASSFNKEELLDICYSELFTRVQNIISGLSMCSVNASSLGSNEIAELLYSAYNRDDKNFMSVEQALEAGFHRLYSTSEDAITKKRKKLIENMKQEAEYKAVKALAKAMEDGTFETEEDAADAYDQETSKQAIEIVKKERVPENMKQKAKKIIVEEYKEAKKERLETKEKKIQEFSNKLASLTGNANDADANVLDAVDEDKVEQPEAQTGSTDADDSIV